MPDDQLLDRLVGGLRPVRRRRPGIEAIAVAGLCAVELALLLGLGFARPDMPMAMGLPSFWWKLGSLGVIAASGTVTAILSLDPAASPGSGLRRLLALVALCLLCGWCIDASRPGLAGLLVRLDWHDGVACVTKMVVLSLAPLLGLGLLMRRAAPTQPGGTSLAVGLSAGALGAFVFVFACPHDDPFYVAVWYLVGCGLVTLAARSLLPMLTRW